MVTNPHPGMKAKTRYLGSTKGMFVHRQHLDNRIANEEVELFSWVPGHGGDVWFCRHDDGEVAVYSTEELVEIR